MNKGGTAAPKVSLSNIDIHLIWYVVILLISFYLLVRSAHEAKYSSVDSFNSFICDVCLLKELHIGGLVISISKGSHNVAEK